MQVFTKNIYVAEDGKEFDNPWDCKVWEKELNKQKQPVTWAVEVIFHASEALQFLAKSAEEAEEKAKEYAKEQGRYWFHNYDIDWEIEVGGAEEAD